MSCEHNMIEVKCSQCGTVDRYCANYCGFGSGHAHAMPSVTVTQMTTDHELPQGSMPSSDENFLHTIAKEEGKIITFGAVKNISDHELLTRIDVRITELENGINIVESNGFLGANRLFVQNSKMELSFMLALRAVVEKNPRVIEPVIERLDVEERAYTDGYNQCLADVKADIEKVLLEKGGE